MIFYPGTMDHALTVSLEGLVIDHEVCNMIHRILEGIAVTDESLALGVVSKVGPGGHYLNQKHTTKHLEKEHYIPKLLDRDSYEVWQDKGQQGMLEKAKAMVKKILEEHQPLPMDQAVEKELLAIIREVEKREGI